LNKTRIAVAGAGYIGQAHIDALRNSRDCELSAIVDPSSSAKLLAQAAGVPLYVSLDEMLAQDRPEGVVIATPNQLHRSHALTCLMARIPILLEKPITPTVSEAEALVQDAERIGVPVLIGHHRAHSPIMAKARQVVESGVLGQVVAVTGSAMFLKPDHYFVDAPWRKEPGAGPILLNMIHEVHNLRMLCGEIESVQAFSSCAARGFAVEDTVAINLRFASGALGSFMLSDVAASARSWEQTSQENKDYPSSDDEDCYVVAGTNGSLAIPTMRLKTYPRPEERSWRKPFEVGVVGLVRDDPVKRQMSHFGAVVRGEVAPIVTARDGLRNLQVTEAIVAAARMGTPVSIPLN